MSLELYRQNGIVVTRASNGFGKGTRIELMVEAPHGNTSIETVDEALQLVIAILKWVAFARGQEVTVTVEVPRR